MHPPINGLFRLIPTCVRPERGRLFNHFCGGIKSKLPGMSASARLLKVASVQGGCTAPRRRDRETKRERSCAGGAFLNEVVSSRNRLVLGASS